MAFEHPGLDVSAEAAGDLSGAQFRFCVIDSNGQAAQAGAGVSVAGVLQGNEANVQGAAVSIRVAGLTKCEAGGVIANGADVMSDAQGRAVTATTGNFVAGKAWLAASGAGTIITVDVTSRGGQLN